MPKANELKRGDMVVINDTPHVVKNVECKSPSSRGASTLYKIRFTNLISKQKLDQSFKSDELLRQAECYRVQVQFSYIDGSNYIFMNMEDYTQYELSRDDIEDQVLFLTDGLEGITALLQDEKVLGIELPGTVILTIKETSPAIKGASATKRTKTAILSTGLEIQVPEYIESDEQVKVNTATAKYLSRM
ncbi:MAG: elongation factor P-like protein YeiP [Thiohalomonadales bacterium]